MLWEITLNLSWKTRYFNDVEYSAKLQALMVVINASHDLLQLHGRQLYLAALAAKDARLQQLFEPLLFALPYDILERYAREHSLDYGTFYCQFMKNIYTPQNADRELLRRMVLTMALHAAARYVAAYESNTAGKNTSGFDDVRSLFPETQRMSIHRKDERYGHFSVQISPSFSRVPWHGVAVLVPSEKGLMLDIRLERELRAEGYIAVTSAVREKAPLFYVPPGTSKETVEQMMSDRAVPLYPSSVQL